MPTRPAFWLLVTLPSSSWPIGPSITFCMCAVLRNRKGRLKTLRSSITGPSAPTLTRANWMAPIWACSMASFSPPSCIAANIGKKLETATNGRLGVQMFAAMQLGGEKEAIEQAQIGAIQFARVSVGALGPVIDDLNVFN